MWCCPPPPDNPRYRADHGQRRLGGSALGPALFAPAGRLRPVSVLHRRRTAAAATSGAGASAVASQLPAAHGLATHRLEHGFEPRRPAVITSASRRHDWLADAEAAVLRETLLPSKRRRRPLRRPSCRQRRGRSHPLTRPRRHRRSPLTDRPLVPSRTTAVSRLDAAMNLCRASAIDHLPGPQRAYQGCPQRRWRINSGITFSETRERTPQEQPLRRRWSPARVRRADPTRRRPRPPEAPS